MLEMASNFKGIWELMMYGIWDDGGCYDVSENNMSNYNNI
jgi:hypothetical protein